MVLNMRKIAILLLIICYCLVNISFAANSPSAPTTSATTNSPTANPAQQLPDIEIRNARARPASHNTNSAAYMMIKNNSDQSYNLIGVSELGLAQNIELHQTVVDNKDGKASMKNIDKILIPAKTELLFKPGSYHIMIMGLKKDLVAGKKFTLDLKFEKSDDETTILGPKKIEVVVDNNAG
jgi:periplasmic copper chaperone A